MRQRADTKFSAGIIIAFHSPCVWNTILAISVSVALLSLPKMTALLKIDQYPLEISQNQKHVMGCENVKYYKLYLIKALCYSNIVIRPLFVRIYYAMNWWV